MGSLTPRKGEILGVEPQPKHAVASNIQKKMIYDSLGGSIDRRFRFLQITLVFVTILILWLS